MNKYFDCVVYHSPCSDGQCAAWIVQKYHTDNNREIELFPCLAGKSPNKELSYFTNKNIIFVDICPSLEYLIELSDFANSICIIDHHKTNYENLSNNKLPENVCCVFDMNFSGCQLTWKYFYDNEMPWFVNYIGDRDIWKFTLPDINELISGIYEQNLINYDGFQEMYNNINDKSYIDNIYSIGKKALEFREKSIQNIIKYKLHCKYKNYNIWLYSSTRDITSDVGNRLLKYKLPDNNDVDFTVGFIYDVKSDEFWISMRSSDDKIDVSEICKELGGGGHRNASGCTYRGALKNLFVPVDNK